MADPARKIATYADVLDAPDDRVAEILDGELHLSPRPGSDHANVSGELYAAVHDRFGRRRGGPGPGGWWVLLGPELHLGVGDPRSVVAVPDLAGWRRERLPEIPRVPAMTLPPDWICEILFPGPSNTRRDRILKPEVYARRGVPNLWFVDPVGRLLEVWELRDTVYARVQAFAGDGVVRAKPFEAAEIDLGDWWLRD